MFWEEHSIFWGRFKRFFLYVIHKRSDVNPKQWNKPLMSWWLCYRNKLPYVHIESIGLIGQVTVSNLHTACAVDFINWLSLNKRGMNSSNVLRARSWDDFHKQITQVVHVWERELSAGWEACCCNHNPASPYCWSSLCLTAKVWSSADSMRIWFMFTAVAQRNERGVTLLFGPQHMIFSST